MKAQIFHNSLDQTLARHGWTKVGVRFWDFWTYALIEYGLTHDPAHNAELWREYGLRPFPPRSAEDLAVDATYAACCWTTGDYNTPDFRHPP